MQLSVTRPVRPQWVKPLHLKTWSPALYTKYHPCVCRCANTSAKGSHAKYCPLHAWVAQYIYFGHSDYEEPPGATEANETKLTSLIARFMGPTWGPSGAARTQVGPMLAPSTFLSGPVKALNQTASVNLASEICTTVPLVGKCHPHNMVHNIIY